MEKIVLKVTGMGCDHCVNTITQAIDNLPGIESVHVSLTDATVTIQQNTAETSIETIKSTIEDAGYDVE